MEWKVVRNFERYMVSETGLVMDMQSCTLLEPSNDRYLFVHLYYEGQSHYSKVYSVHRLVAEMFIPISSDSLQVNHKDGNKHNNNVSNLEWCTQSENTQHAYDSNLITKMLGERNPMAKLTEQEVIMLRDIMCDSDILPVDLSKATGINKITLLNALQGTTWKHVLYRIDETKQSISRKFKEHLASGKAHRLK